VDGPTDIYARKWLVRLKLGACLGVVNDRRVLNGIFWVSRLVCPVVDANGLTKIRVCGATNDNSISSV
jgi:hypothetical protein